MRLRVLKAFNKFVINSRGVKVFTMKQHGTLCKWLANAGITLPMFLLPTVTHPTFCFIIKHTHKERKKALMSEVRHFAAFSNMLEQLCYFKLYSTFHNNFKHRKCTQIKFVAK